MGAGGLGNPLLQYLGAAGVGRIGIVDFDTIDVTNLQRQVMYGTKDVGRKKLEVAKERVQAINPNVDVQTFEERFAPNISRAGLFVRAKDPVPVGSRVRFEYRISLFQYEAAVGTPAPGQGKDRP